MKFLYRTERGGGRLVSSIAIDPVLFQIHPLSDTQMRGSPKARDYCSRHTSDCKHPACWIRTHTAGPDALMLLGRQRGTRFSRASVVLYFPFSFTVQTGSYRRGHGVETITPLMAPLKVHAALGDSSRIKQSSRSNPRWSQSVPCRAVQTEQALQDLECQL